MIYLNCDYNEGAHENILKALWETNMTQSPGYGEDAFCQEARELIRAHCEGDPAVHFLVGGTGANLTVISAALRPHQCVLSAQQGHINVHETGAIEAGGHKVIPLPSQDGKLTASQIREAVEGHWRDGAHEHITQPKLVYLTFPTELGAIYTKAELEEVHALCQEHRLLLYIDGARLGYGLTSRQCDVTLRDLSRLCDVFYIGGTKQGALFGEAVVIQNPAIAEDFRYIMKQKGGMMAKGRLLGIQFRELFREGLYFQMAKEANILADKLRGALGDGGYVIPVDHGTNQVFAVMPDTHLEILGKGYVYEYFERVDEKNSLVRFCTSWATQEGQIDALIRDIKAL